MTLIYSGAVNKGSKKHFTECTFDHIMPLLKILIGGSPLPAGWGQGSPGEYLYLSSLLPSHWGTSSSPNASHSLVTPHPCTCSSLTVIGIFPAKPSSTTLEPSIDSPLHPVLHFIIAPITSYWNYLLTQLWDSWGWDWLLCCSHPHFLNA